VRRQPTDRTAIGYDEPYVQLTEESSPAPLHWAPSCTHQECTLHQLSPYIGKLKSVIAQDIINKYSKPGQLVVDPFCGSGTVPLEAARLGRRVFASDASIYAVTLAKGKLHPPGKVEDALAEIDHFLKLAESLPMPDLRRTPLWVRMFFHPRTLKETLRFCELLQDKRRYFLLGALLGILHHQRPGFLSYPSSHLVPYLRTKKFPRHAYSSLYEYRPIAPRLKAKVLRMMKRPPERILSKLVDGIRKSSVERVNLPESIDCVITSPPYMNALDYGRDNRLRLWFLKESHLESMDRILRERPGFIRAIEALAKQLQQKIRQGGYCIFIVGDYIGRNSGGFPSRELLKIFTAQAPTLQLHEVIRDIIPDIRRSRRKHSAVKQENILVFRKI